jgi:SAM-dependent methyltransferase
VPMNPPKADRRSIFPYPPPLTRHNIGCYHADPLHAGADYPEGVFEKLIRIEDGYFWFEARNDVLRLMVETHLDQNQRHSFLEIGCGTGNVLRLLASLPNLSVAGAEVHAAGAAMAAARVPEVEVVQLDVLRMDFPAAFDAIGVFDVLEHLEDDIAALVRIREALKPGGMCFVTVPQHPWLWSSQDDVSGHKRRYTRPQLTAHLERAGLKPVFLTSFFFFVMPFFVASRMLKKAQTFIRKIDEPADPLVEMFLPPWLNGLLRRLSALDLRVIRRGLSLPFGGSLFALAIRRD